MNIISSIQARMASSRLPGKVLKDISGKPMLLWHVERIRRSRLIDKVVVATTTSKRDDEIELFCNNHSIACFRGSENNVLNRIASLIHEFDVDIHVEFCGDSPLIDPQIIDEFVGYLLKNLHKYDYVSNSLKTTYPPGQEVSVYLGHILEKIDLELDIKDPMREYVGYNISRFRKRFRIASLEAPPWYYAPEVYLEVDSKVDLDLIKSIIGYFVQKKMPHFTLSQILELLNKYPNWIQINNKEERRWKEFREKSDG